MIAKSISSLMTHDHRNCDLAIEEMEQFASIKDFNESLNAFTKWQDVNLAHFNIEEEYLFPETINALGMKIPPIMVMEMEHQQIKKCLTEIELALRQEDMEKFQHLIETCLIMIQQHNMKEEQILYPIIDKALYNKQDELVTLIANKLHQN